MKRVKATKGPITKEIGLEAELKQIQRELRKLRKSRTDKGMKRLPYKTNTSPKYNHYLKRANAKQIPFSLTDEHFIELESANCNYCGDQATGFDRINSKGGYTPDNIKPCCSTCNMMKNAATVKDFLGQINKIYTHINAQD